MILVLKISFRSGFLTIQNIFIVFFFKHWKNQIRDAFIFRETGRIGNFSELFRTFPPLCTLFLEKTRITQFTVRLANKLLTSFFQVSGEQPKLLTQTQNLRIT